MGYSDTEFISLCNRLLKIISIGPNYYIKRVIILICHLLIVSKIHNLAMKYASSTIYRDRFSAVYHILIDLNIGR